MGNSNGCSWCSSRIDEDGKQKEFKENSVDRPMRSSQIEVNSKSFYNNDSQLESQIDDTIIFPGNSRESTLSNDIIVND